MFNLYYLEKLYLKLNLSFNKSRTKYNFKVSSPYDDRKFEIRKFNHFNDLLSDNNIYYYYYNIFRKVFKNIVIDSIYNCFDVNYNDRLVYEKIIELMLDELCYGNYKYLKNIDHKEEVNIYKEEHNEDDRKCFITGKTDDLHVHHLRCGNYKSIFNISDMDTIYWCNCTSSQRNRWLIDLDGDLHNEYYEYNEDTNTNHYDPNVFCDFIKYHKGIEFKNKFNEKLLYLLCHEYNVSQEGFSEKLLV